MADNVAITPGSGATAAADDISGILYQRVKITVGADGTNDGDVAVGNPMPVSVPLAVSAVILTLTTAATVFASSWSTTDMYWAVMLNGACIAKVVWDEERPYEYPHPHDEMICDPDNEIAVEEYQE